MASKILIKNLLKSERATSMASVSGCTKTCLFSKEKKIRSMPDVSVTVITKSANYRPSSIKNHDSSFCHSSFAEWLSVCL